jgi:hypothetical protein
MFDFRDWRWNDPAEVAPLIGFNQRGILACRRGEGAAPGRGIIANNGY